MAENLNEDLFIREFPYIGSSSYKASDVLQLLRGFTLPSPIQDRKNPTIWLQEYLDSIQNILQNDKLKTLILDKLFSIAVGQGGLERSGIIDAVFSVPPLESFYKGLFNQLSRFGRCGIFGKAGMGKTRILNYIALEWMQTYETPVYFIERPQILCIDQWKSVENTLNLASKQFGPYKILLIINNMQDILDLESHRNSLQILFNNVTKNTYAIVFAYSTPENPSPDFLRKEEYVKNLCGSGINPVNYLTPEIWAVWQPFIYKWATWMAPRILNRIELSRWTVYMEKGGNLRHFPGAWSFINELSFLLSNLKKYILDNPNPMVKLVYLLVHSCASITNEHFFQYNSFLKYLSDGIISSNKEIQLQPIRRWFEQWQDINIHLIPSIAHFDPSKQENWTITIYHEEWSKEVIRLLYHDNPDNLFKISINRFLERVYPTLYKLWQAIPSYNNEANFFDWMLSRCRFQSDDLMNITHLSLDNCGFDSIPDCLWELTHLKILNLNQNRLENIPNEIEKLSDLIQLQLNNNRISVIDPGLGMLNYLEELTLRENKLFSLPETVANLVNLYTLDISTNSLTYLPKTIGNLKLLKKLSAQKNNLNNLPFTIGGLEHLEDLNLDNNNLIDLPFSIGYITKITSLSINSNQLQNIPESIGGMEKLIHLSLHSNKLTNLPSSICQLAELEILSIFSNKLQSIPEEIGSLHNLKELKIGSNRISSLPESLGKLQYLKSLNASNNQLTSIPESIGDLYSLKILNLDRNRLVSVPESLCKLNSLNSLSLIYNDLKSIPAGIKDIRGLQKLNLYGNRMLSQNRTLLNSLIRPGLTITK